MMRSGGAGEPSAAAPAGIRASAYLPELEGLRGIAVLLVYTFHADRFLTIAPELAGIDTRAVASPLVAFIRAGHTGVTLFFVLSGFLLSLPFLAEADGGPRVDRRRYVERRALRILPLYWVLLLVAVLVAGGGLRRALPYVAFVNGFLPSPPTLPPFTNVVWSLATEAQYYVLLPLLPLAWRWPRVGLAVLGAYALAWGLWIAGRVGPQDGSGAFQLGLSIFGRGWTFLAGIGAAWVWRRHGDPLRARAAQVPALRYGGADALLVLVLLGLGGCLVWELHRPAVRVPCPPVVGWHLVEGVAWALVVLLVLLAPLRSAPLFRSRVLTGLGVLSYSIYVWHVPVYHYGLRLFRRWWGAPPYGWDGAGVLVYTTLSVVVLAVSTCTYVAIERPFLRRKTHLRI
jgi:peptidoglycan/LPS O-acetylase OafA/YrhL